MSEKREGPVLDDQQDQQPNDLQVLDQQPNDWVQPQMRGGRGGGGFLARRGPVNQGQNNQGQNNQGQNNQIQNQGVLHGPIIPSPPNVDGVKTKALGEVDTIPLKQRRWSVSTLAVLGLNSRSSQDRVLSSAIATTTRIDETALQPNVGPHCASALKGTYNGNQLDQDPPFKDLVNQLEAFENKAKHPTGQKKARGSNDIAQLRQAATQFALSLQGVQNPDPVKVAALEEVKRVTRAFELRDQVLASGNPPWPNQTAKSVSAAKVELDLLSMPPGQREMEVNASPGQHDSYWIKKQSGRGPSERSFICKPKQTDQDIDGIPVGGEVARESMVKRVGTMLNSKLGLTLDIPETHSLSLDNSFFPNNARNPNGTSVACSVQEIRPNQGPLTGKSKRDLAQVPKEQVHALAILDMTTLNVDRHGGNLLLDPNNELVPIDHGGSLPDPSMDEGRGLERISATMSTKHNALLAFPSAHEPMSKELRESLAKLKPDAIAEQMKQERNAVLQDMSQSDPNLGDPSVLSDSAIESSRRSMHFMQIAAKKYPSLSPASLQVALGANAARLLDPKLNPKKFESAAKAVLEEAVRNQELTKQSCLMNGAEQIELQDILQQNGWTVWRNGPPSRGLHSNPGIALKMALHGMQMPDGMPPARNTNLPRPPPPVPAAKNPSQQELTDLQKRYRRLNENQINRFGLDLAEEVAADRAIQKVQAEDPDLWDEVVALKVVPTVGNDRIPTAVLRAIQKYQRMKTDLARAEKSAGGPMQHAEAALKAFKLTAARNMVNLIRGPLNQSFTQRLDLAQQQNQSADEIGKISDMAFELVRSNLTNEVRTLRGNQAIDEQGAQGLNDLIAAGRLQQADGQLGNIANYVRPDTQ